MSYAFFFFFVLHHQEFDETSNITYNALPVLKKIIQRMLQLLLQLKE